MLQIKTEDLTLKKFKETALIGIISDLHLGNEKSKKALKLGIKKVNKRKVDFIFLLGDFIDSKKGLLDLKLLSKLKSKNEIFAVLGNHDWGMPFKTWTRKSSIADEITEKLTKMGIKVLRNESFLAKKGKSKINILGVESLWSKMADLEKTFSGINLSYPIFLLSHNPDIVFDLKKNQPTDLIISGHTHGYLIRLPAKKPRLLIVNTKLGRDFDKGFKIYEAPRTYARGTSKCFSERNPPQSNVAGPFDGSPKHYPPSRKASEGYPHSNTELSAQNTSHNETNRRPWSSAKADKKRLIYITVGIGEIKLFPRAANPPEVVFLKIN